MEYHSSGLLAGPPAQDNTCRPMIVQSAAEITREHWIQRITVGAETKGAFTLRTTSDAQGRTTTTSYDIARPRTTYVQKCA